MELNIQEDFHKILGDPAAPTSCFIALYCLTSFQQFYESDHQPAVLIGMISLHRSRDKHTVDHWQIHLNGY
jgi:hypothetical protein